MVWPMTATVPAEPAAEPRKKRPTKQRCAVCTALILPDDVARSLPGLGRCHEDCADEMERGAEEGGCNPTEYFRIYGAVMEAE